MSKLPKAFLFCFVILLLTFTLTSILDPDCINQLASCGDGGGAGDNVNCGG